jgi:hypothetical protein
MTLMDENFLGMKCGLVDIRMTRARGIHYPCSSKQPRCQLKVRLNQKVGTQPFSSFVLFAWQCKHAPNTIKILSQGLPTIEMSQLIHVGKRAAPP